MKQIVTLLDQKIAIEEKKLYTLIREYKKQSALLDTDNYNLERKDLIKALKQIRAKLLKLLEKSD